MPAQVISFAERKEALEPHRGKAKCIGCRHEWEAVAPVGTDTLDCPGCDLPKGKFIYEIIRGEKMWECKCGNDLFRIHQDIGVYCINCAAPQTGWFA